MATEQEVIEIEDKAEEQEVNRNINNVHLMLDGKVMACFSVYEKESMGMCCGCGSWVNYDKVFDTMKEFSSFAETFLNLKEKED